MYVYMCICVKIFYLRSFNDVLKQVFANMLAQSKHYGKMALYGIQYYVWLLTGYSGQAITLEALLL